MPENKIKIAVIVGARPNFIKIAPLFWEFKKWKNIAPILIHTGQHYDYKMSEAFFKELDIPEPDYNLDVKSGSHGYQVGTAIIGLEKTMMNEKPAVVVVVGDVNAVLAGSIVAAKLHVPLAHIESGLRSFKKTMPEEINRIMSDHVSDLLFCPTRAAVDNLKCEGIKRGVYNTGDIMFDVLLEKIKDCDATVLEKMKIEPKDYFLLTVHRAENVDNEENLKKIIGAVSRIGVKVIYPVHPRAAAVMKKPELQKFFAPEGNIYATDPVGYLEMLALEKNAGKILTDSGGVQKEAFWLGVPCVTLRDETEWVETVANGWNVLAGTDEKKIVRMAKNFTPNKRRQNHYGDGHAAQKITRILVKNFSV